MATDKLVSDLVERQFPDFIRENGPTFVSFLKAYYEWAEQSNNIIDVTKNLIDYRQVATSLDGFKIHFQNEFIPSIPDGVLADKDRLVQYANQAHRARGSEKSYQLLFRILYDEEIQFYYPGVDILKASDGNWVKTTAIRVTGDDTIFDMAGFKITGGTSGVTAIAETVVKIIVDGQTLYEIQISNITLEGAFTKGS